MLIIRYFNKQEVKDFKVTVENAHESYRHICRKYGHAELILIEKDGTEYCLM